MFMIFLVSCDAIDANRVFQKSRNDITLPIKSIFDKEQYKKNI